jgi:NAD(P)H-nitrite reductase large subunit
MPRLLDQETADYVLKDLKDIGVDVRLNTEGKECVGGENIEGVRTSKGEILRADLYIAATGVKPNIAFLEQSDIAHGWGITVNEYLQATHPFIYACGDVAETRDLVTGNTKIHGLYPVAIAHGRTAAMNIMGAGIRYEQQLNMNSLKELRRNVIVVGRQTNTVLKRKDKQNLRKVYLDNDKIAGFVLVGNISGAGTYLAMMRKGTDVSLFGKRLLSRHFHTALAMTRMVHISRHAAAR